MDLWRRRKHSGSTVLRLYYASDVHGSDLCWRKFLNAAKHYDARVLVMGGDLTGKALVPIVRTNGSGSWTARVAGEERLATTAKERDELEKAIRMNGFYPLEVTSEEHRAMREDAALAEQRFAQAMKEELTRWVALADERLVGTDVEAYVMPGNDDPWFVDEILTAGASVRACDGEVVRIGEHEMISCGYSNRTPWNTPRELDESELYKRMRALAERLEAPERAIFNLHVPPYDSGLDTAVELDGELRPVLEGGRPHEIPVGSSAVRQLIEEFQPAVALHGHIHESRGIVHIGRTVAINPGSEYTTGRIEGCVVDLVDGSVRSFRLVSG